MIEKFIIYIRTLQILTMSRRGDEAPKPVFISQKEIESKWLPYPKYNRKEVLKDLEAKGILRIHKGKYFKYEILTKGDIDFSLLPKKQENFKSPIIYKIRNELQKVSLSANAPSTLYFDAFLKFKDDYIEYFFTVDDFSRRIHTPVTNLHREYRRNILIDGEKTSSLDVVTMQPLLLGKILNEQIGDNEYSSWINSGQDIYLILKEKAGLKSRDEAKKRFFEILFSKPNNNLVELFGNSKWIEWINKYKALEEPRNPHSKEKPHSNLAWLLQSTEVKIMFEVWKELVFNRIPFLTIHDEILTQTQHEKRSKQIFEEVLNKHFQYYKLNSKINDNKKEHIINVTNQIPTWETDISELNIFFEKAPIPDTIKLNSFTSISNVPKFIQSHIATIEANKGNPTFRPYLDRLIDLKNEIQNTF